MGDCGTICSGDRLVGQMSYENKAQEGGAILEGRSVCEVQPLETDLTDVPMDTGTLQTVVTRGSAERAENVISGHNLLTGKPNSKDLIAGTGWLLILLSSLIFSPSSEYSMTSSSWGGCAFDISIRQGSCLAPIHP